MEKIIDNLSDEYVCTIKEQFECESLSSFEEVDPNMIIEDELKDSLKDKIIELMGKEVSEEIYNKIYDQLVEKVADKLDLDSIETELIEQFKECQSDVLSNIGLDESYFL